MASLSADIFLLQVDELSEEKNPSVNFSATEALLLENTNSNFQATNRKQLYFRQGMFKAYRPKSPKSKNHLKYSTSACRHLAVLRQTFFGVSGSARVLSQVHTSTS
jgi:hypothetical protein